MLYKKSITKPQRSSNIICYVLMREITNPKAQRQTAKRSLLQFERDVKPKSTSDWKRILHLRRDMLSEKLTIFITIPL